MRSPTDAVFLLPSWPSSVAVVGVDDELGDPLVALGVRRVAIDGPGVPDVVFSSHKKVTQALERPPPALIVYGGGRVGRLARAGYASRPLLALPSAERPEMIIPVSPASPLRYALARTPPVQPWKRLRNVLAVGYLARSGPVPPSRSILLGSRSPGPPFLIGEAARLGVPSDVDWILYPSQGDLLSRGAFHLFRGGEADPAWVLKFTRVRGYTASFEADERGLGIAAAAGGCVAAHAPRLLGRVSFAGLHASLETAAVGGPLSAYLASGIPRARGLAEIEAIARWILDVAASTSTPAVGLMAERERLRNDIVAAWAWAGASASLVDDLPSLRGVLQHNDLGTWNIVVTPSTPGGFTTLDWESACEVGMPLWDLWYFLQHALAQLDGISGLNESDIAARERHAVRLFRGELPASGTLFAWTRRLVAAADVPAEAVGRLATLCFLHHGLSQAARDRTVRRHDSGSGALETVGPKFARRWLSDPLLGAGWSCWR